MSINLQTKRFTGALATGLVLFLAVSSAKAQQFQQKVVPPPFNWSHFGETLDSDLDTLVVGAPNSIRNNDTSNCTIVQSDYGAVAIFKKVAGSWALAQTLWHDPYPTSDTFTYEPRFGSAVRYAGTLWPWRRRDCRTETS